MPEWMHNRAEHILAKNPSMSKSQAFAIATNQSHALGKTPKGYGTAEGKAHAREVYDTPKGDEHKANPGGLKSAKMEKKAENHGVELAGLGILAVPSIDHLQAAARARIAGDKTPEGVERRRFLGDNVGHAMEVGGLGVLAAPEVKALLARGKNIAKHAGVLLNKGLLHGGVGAVLGAGAGALTSEEGSRLTGALEGAAGGAALGAAGGYAAPRMRSAMKAGLGVREAAKAVGQDAAAHGKAGLSKLKTTMVGAAKSKVAPNVAAAAPAAEAAASQAARPITEGHSLNSLLDMPIARFHAPKPPPRVPANELPTVAIKAAGAHAVASGLHGGIWGGFGGGLLGAGAAGAFGVDPTLGALAGGGLGAAGSGYLGYKAGKKEEELAGKVAHAFLDELMQISRAGR